MSYFWVEGLSYALIILFSILVSKFVLPTMKKKEKEYIYSMVLMIGFFIYQFYLVSFFPQTYIKKIGLSLMLIIVGIVSFFLFRSYKKEQLLTFELEKKEIEEKYLMNYLNQVNREYKDIRKFKHDYINLLSSLEYVINQGDIDSIKSFYSDSINPSKESMKNDYSNIGALEKIKLNSLKSILAVKILQAEENNINVSLEIIDDISQKLLIKDTILIRMIGIIIDNAIEETLLLDDGEIQIAIFSDKEYVYLIVKNNVRPTIEPLHVLKKEGFSTKGDNRGIGLSNLQELTENNSNIMLETQINKGFFIQKMMIKTEELEQ
ncbi:MAG: GHKL domain-containing protein [Vagococcus sp.]|uniref:GHKL domain-containing protein n=1 Tax=Vagococcus TaxID=2737 RepID=UPI002FC8C328